ncbi:choice-of-anchor I domain-containing protein [Brevibacillus sp. SYSU BS000544]|uniref:choice-of-anchor I domain-containing protein n=1 Tax=Brevibacillus sp. SYSU BS000544 TaxID=3416443 RepID=UPI003CE51789
MKTCHKSFVHGLALLIGLGGWGATVPTVMANSPQPPAKVQKVSQTEIQYITKYQMKDKKAEIAASTPDGKQLIVTQAAQGSISIVSIADLEHIVEKQTIRFQQLSPRAEVTSTAVTPDGKYALVTVRTGDDVNTPNKGLVAVVDLQTYQTVKTYQVGIGPDSIAISHDGKTAVICNEDEELDPAQENEIDYSKVKRPGTISILSFPDGDVLRGTHKELSIRLDGLGNHVVYPNDPQPEYVAISPNDTQAAVTLQENNAIALIDLKQQRITKIFGLGVTKHKADLKNDGVVSFQNDLVARPESDGITWTWDGKYMVTANEGDLGKNEFKDGVMSGGRNISVWDQTGRLVYDSKELIDQANAKSNLYPDKRSPNRGSEVENLTIGEIGTKSILAVASERGNSILFFDLTKTEQPEYLGLLPSGGEGPEGIHKIHGRDLFVSADEETGTLSFYGIK